jgi:PTS system galactitol-specific IIA component
MGEEKRWVHEEIVVLPLNAANAAEAITQLGTRLQEHGFVKDSWIQATIEREKVYATGLPTAEIGVAIPHTDAEHVLKQAIAVGILEEPVEFVEMGSTEDKVLVTIVCALAVTKSESLASLLQQLVEMFQSPGVLRQIADAAEPGEIVAVFDRHLQAGD